MRWSIVKVIWFREVRDQLRDRRTLFVLLVLPVVMYPLLGLGMLQFTVLFAEQQSQVGVAGLERLEAAGLPPLVECEYFADYLFPKKADKSERKLIRVVQGEESALVAKLRSGDIQGLLVFGPEFIAGIQAGRRTAVDLRLKGSETYDASRLWVPPPSAEKEPEIECDEDRGRLAYARVRGVLREWSTSLLFSRIAALSRAADPGGWLRQPDQVTAVVAMAAGACADAPAANGLWPRALHSPALTVPADFHRPLYLAPLQTKNETVWVRIFPFLLVMMALAGALYPAIDVCAGEKERGTMETLLISPASRSEIVAGKFLTVCLFSSLTALLNLVSLSLTTLQFSSLLSNSASGALSRESMPALSLAALGWCATLMVPLAAFFAAVCLALAVYARSTKEGQYYLTPLTIVTLLLTFLSVAPGAELSPFTSIIPITGVTLLLQELMNARTPEAVPWIYIAPVLVPLAAYCYLALYWAIQQFHREEVLFREAEHIDLLLWLRRLLREKEPLPSGAMAMACFFGLLLLRWLFSTTWDGQYFLVKLTVFQISCIAAPPLFMALLLTSRPLVTLRLCRPRPHAILLAVALAFVLHVPTARIAEAVVSQLPVTLQEQVKQWTETIIDVHRPLWMHLLVLALVPAVAEELAFRGFILTGLAQRLGNNKAILASSLLFAFSHLNAFQFLSTFLLGLVLGYLAVKSGSLVPGIIFHAIHNGIFVAVAYYGQWWKALKETEPAWITEHGLYSLPVIAVCAIAAGVLLLAVSRLRPGAGPVQKRV